MYFLLSVPSSSPENITFENINSTSMTISWDEIDCLNQNGVIEEYWVYLTYNISETEQERTLDSDQTSITVNGLFPNTSYKVQIAAVNSNGSGPFSDAVTHTTKPPNSKLIIPRH